MTKKWRETFMLAVAAMVLGLTFSLARADGKNVVIPLDMSDPLISSVPKSDDPPVFENGDAGALRHDHFFAVITPEDSVNFEADEPASSAYVSKSVNDTIFLRNSFNTQYDENDLYLHCVWEVTPNAAIATTSENYCEGDAEEEEQLYPITLPFSIGGRPCVLECDPTEFSDCSCEMLNNIVKNRISVIQTGTAQ